MLTSMKQGRIQDSSKGVRPASPPFPLPLPSPPPPLPRQQLGGLGSAVSSPSGVWDGAPATKDFGAF